MSYEIIIGLEVHVQLKTVSKLFCGCRTEFGAEANTQTCPICLGLPGVLPVLNQQALDYAMKTALALNCKVALFTKFDRKNYFYPDLPKNYQISQYDLPLAQDGHLEIEINKQSKRIGITRVHLEEDAGKLIHEEARSQSPEVRSQNEKTRVGSYSGQLEHSDLPAHYSWQYPAKAGLPHYSLVDLNRTGIPLMEIVSQPEINSPQEAYEYLTALKGLLEYLNISDCDMEKGSLRCDANLSVRPEGSKEFGTKTELKNLNSFKFIAKALDYETKRQINLLGTGGKIVLETRLWDTEKEQTLPMRSKEEAHDYRYFPEPDLVPIKIDQDWLARIRESLPELPKARKNRFVKQYQIPEYDAGVLTQDKALADYFEECIKYYSGQLEPASSADRHSDLPAHYSWQYPAKAGLPHYNSPKSISNWIMGEVLHVLKEEKLAIHEFNIKPQALVELIKRFDKKDITSTVAKKVLAQMRKTGQSADEIIQAKGLVQVSDRSVLEGIIEEVIKNNPKIVVDYKGGKKTAVQALVGQVMRASRGKANPQVAKEMLQTRLDK